LFIFQKQEKTYEYFCYDVIVIRRMTAGGDTETPAGLHLLQIHLTTGIFLQVNTAVKGKNLSPELHWTYHGKAKVLLLPAKTRCTGRNFCTLGDL
jgi:hypothetical protein